jgi:hypothetical protein
MNMVVETVTVATDENHRQGRQRPLSSRITGAFREKESLAGKRKHVLLRNAGSRASYNERT